MFPAHLRDTTHSPLAFIYVAAFPKQAVIYFILKLSTFWDTIFDSFKLVLIRICLVKLAFSAMLFFFWQITKRYLLFTDAYFCNLSTILNLQSSLQFFFINCYMILINYIYINNDLIAEFIYFYTYFLVMFVLKSLKWIWIRYVDAVLRKTIVLSF